MKNPWSHAALLTAVTQTLSQVLGIQPEEIEADAGLINDLGADSLDFVEFRYNLEKQLGILLPKKSVLDHLAECVDGSGDAIYENGRLTQLAAHVLRQSFFRYTDEQVYAGTHPQDVMALTSVRHWTNYCHTLFDHLPSHCPDCRATQAALDRNGKAVCSSCSAVLMPTSGDVAFGRYLGEFLQGRSLTSVAA